MEVGSLFPFRDHVSTAHVVSTNAVKNQTATDQQNSLKPKVAAWKWGLNGFLVPSETHTHFAYHKKLDDYYVQVIDNKTNQMIREVPPKEILDMYAAIAKKFGIIVDEQI